MPSSESPASGYRQILRSTSIIGGAQGINYVIGMIRMKLVAVLLGPSGVGLVGLYTSTTSMLAIAAGLGIGTSGVREVAEAHSSGDQLRLKATVTTLRRVCWLTGLLGWILCVALSYPLSIWTFGSPDRAWAISLLGVTLLLGSISNGQSALLQGTRRISDLAKFNIVSVLTSTIFALALYAWLREHGIVPVIIVTGVVNLGFSWWFAKSIALTEITQQWSETLAHSRRLISLGLAFMWSGFLTAVVALAVRALIVRELGLEANGVYQAAWGLSGMFAGFILGAMGADFYPRLTGVAHDKVKVNCLLNEQTEIGILLALPGLLGTLAFAPLIMHFFYSEKFLLGAALLPWFILGVFGQVISWPLGFCLIAKGAKSWYVASETVANLLKLVLTYFLLKHQGLVGTAITFPLLYLAYTFLMLGICHHLTGFRCSNPTLKLLATSSVLIAMAFSANALLSQYPKLAVGALLTVVGGILSLRGVVSRLGSEHSIVRLVHRIPVLRIFCIGIDSNQITSP